MVSAGAAWHAESVLVGTAIHFPGQFQLDEGCKRPMLVELSKSRCRFGLWRSEFSRGRCRRGHLDFLGDLLAASCRRPADRLCLCFTFIRPAATRRRNRSLACTTLCFCWIHACSFLFQRFHLMKSYPELLRSLFQRCMRVLLKEGFHVFCGVVFCRVVLCNVDSSFVELTFVPASNVF